MISQRLQLNISNTQEPKQGLLVESGLISEIPSSKWWNVACPSLWVAQNIVRGQNRSISTVALRDASNGPVGGWMLARREPLMSLYHTTTSTSSFLQPFIYHLSCPQSLHRVWLLRDRGFQPFCMDTSGTIISLLWVQGSWICWM